MLAAVVSLLQLIVLPLATGGSSGAETTAQVWAVSGATSTILSARFGELSDVDFTS